MNKKIFLIVTIIATVSVSTAFAKGGKGCGALGYEEKGRKGYAGYYLPKGYSALTPEAIEKIRVIEQKYYPQIEKIKADIFAQNAIIKAEMLQTNLDKAKITKAIEEKNKLSLSLEKLKLERAIEIKNVK